MTAILVYHSQGPSCITPAPRRNLPWAALGLRDHGVVNRLGSATSPYLLQHKDNPVDWWEWSPEAFEEARQRDIPVLLSVGYSSCHWCHVDDPRLADAGVVAKAQISGTFRAA